MNSLHIVMLFCLQRLKEERTIYGVYHLLKGKKSAQTIQDGQIYGLSFLFQSFPYLRKPSFDSMITTLVQRETIISKGEHVYQVTEKGHEYVQKWLTTNELPSSLNGWQYANVTYPFWKRLLVLFQTASNLVYKEKKFVPVTRDEETLRWLKKFLVRNGQNRTELAHQLFQELKDILKETPQLNVEIFVRQFSGYQYAGETNVQIAKEYNIDEHYVHLCQLATVHFIIHMLKKQKDLYKLLQGLLTDFNVVLPLTSSAKATYELMKRNKSFEDIMRIRRLKKSTIEDHLAEIALFVDDFSLSDYVTNDEQEEIKRVYLKLNTNKLKPIKDEVSSSITYFQIRLVLAHLTKERRVTWS
ncbi:helix-turn-helix domain-containing protein [Priestia endophytica]|uniref:Uncharacterized protein YpbB n=1 Tax=Priestia endophytica DSM 13796 TaxID=1121089 RepID=A0A1I5VZU8_9BACI|nr:helix-turn-helix domain-containing protein [Priestia endophytica]KYG35922.1 hypothetical protein AZF06_01625 [Priestia endophytica]SFQ13058.1 Uncharacterized protein YpbB [Priestia endophytica DSM 13796]